MSLTDSPAGTLTAQRDAARRDYAALVARGLSLDLTRGKPAPEQLSLSEPLLSLPGGQFRAADGTDTRNYGNLQGLAELREIFSGPLDVPVGQLVAGGNSSLELMHDCLVHAMLSGVPGGGSRWADTEPVRFLCPVPGYDRHFALCERFGITMLPVPMTASGPDMDTVEQLVAGDASVKGIWCVPKYSNPDGTCYSDEVVHRLAAMSTAAPDFRVFWDNAYAVHDLSGEPVPLADLLGAAAAQGHPDRVLVFGSTSKITFAGRGGRLLRRFRRERELAARATPPSGPSGRTRSTSCGTPCSWAAGTACGPTWAGSASCWRPSSLPWSASWRRSWAAPGWPGGPPRRAATSSRWRSPDGCAREVVRLAGEAGIALTPAGATHPYGDDPRDATIRIAPTYPGVAELEQAITGLTVCVRLAGYEQQA